MATFAYRASWMNETLTIEASYYDVNSETLTFYSAEEDAVVAEIRGWLFVQNLSI